MGSEPEFRSGECSQGCGRRATTGHMTTEHGIEVRYPLCSPCFEREIQLQITKGISDEISTGRCARDHHPGGRGSLPETFETAWARPELQRCAASMVQDAAQDEVVQKTEGTNAMTAAAKKELVEKNKVAIARIKAKREARAALKGGKKKEKPQGFVQPKPADVKAAVAQHVEEIKQAEARQKKTLGGIALRELKGSVKQKWPQVKGLADAVADELARVLEHGEQEPQILVELQETWAKRARARREAWLKGDSKSAQAARTKQESKT